MHLAVVMGDVDYLIVQVLIHCLVGVVDLLGGADSPNLCASDPPEEHAYAPRRHQPL